MVSGPGNDMENNTTSNVVVGSPAPYGWACASCARAKCRCVTLGTGVRCARCQRLNKECRPASRVRKSNLGRTPTSRTAQLEEKLDGLMSLLQQAAGQGGGGGGGAPATTGSTPSDGTLSASDGSSDQPATDSDGVPGSSSGRPTGVAMNTSAGIEALPRMRIPAAVEEQALAVFRAEKLPYLPVVHIAPTTTVAELKQTSPFLWRCIAALHCTDYSLQGAVNVQVRRAAAKALLVDCERSLDLLQGVLVYLGWIAFTSSPNRGVLSPFVHMALNLVHDIGLDKPAPRDPNVVACFRAAPGQPGARPWVSLARTMSERRAALGCFVVTSSLFNFIGRTDSLRWTPHLRESLDILSESPETPNDTILVQMVRIQLVIDKVGWWTWNERENRERAAPPSFYITALKGELDTIRDQASPEVSQNRVLLLHRCYAEVTIYESVLLKPHVPPDDVDLTRLDNLWACLTAIQTWFRLLFEFPPGAYTSFPTNLIFPIRRCLLTLFHLCTLDCPGWDKAAVRRTADPVAIAQQIADVLAKTGEAANIRNHGSEWDPFTRAARALLEWKATWASKLSEMDAQATNPVAGGGMASWSEGIPVDSWLMWSELDWLAGPIM